MKIIEQKVALENLESVLARSRMEFVTSQDHYLKFRTRFRLGLLDPDTEIKYFEMLESGEVCASFLLVYKRISMNQELVKVCFLTQVIVSTGFRGQGLAYKIAQCAEKAATLDGAGITFVVARRAVRDIYAKLGFVGFSHFPKISLEKTQQIVLPRAAKTTLALEGDSQLILDMYERTYSNLNFYILRSIESIKGFLEMPNFRLELSANKSFYFISTSERVVEIGMNDNASRDEVISSIMEKGMNCLQLHAHHEISRFVIAEQKLYSERFELREGHLLKLHEANLNMSQMQMLGQYIRFPGSQKAEILEIDQW